MLSRNALIISSILRKRQESSNRFLVIWNEIVDYENILKKYFMSYWSSGRWLYLLMSLHLIEPLRRTFFILRRRDSATCLFIERIYFSILSGTLVAYKYEYCSKYTLFHLLFESLMTLYMIEYVSKEEVLCILSLWSSQILY